MLLTYDRQQHDCIFFLSWYVCVEKENMLSVLRNVRPWCVECISFSVTGVASGVTSDFSSLKIPCGAGKVWGKGRTCLTSIRDSLHWVVAIFSSTNSNWQNWLEENVYEFMPTVWRDQIYRYQDFFRRPKSPRVSKKKWQVSRPRLLFAGFAKVLQTMSNHVKTLTKAM